MNPFPADLQNLIDTAIADKAKAVRGVSDIAMANSELEAARKKVDDLNQIELDASNQAAISEPAAINAFTQWLRDQGTAAAGQAATPEQVSATAAQDAAAAQAAADRQAEGQPADPTLATE